MSFSVKMTGFDTEKKALAFIHFFEGAGEQMFSDWLLDNGMDCNCSCVDLSHVDGSNTFWNETATENGGKQFAIRMKN